MIKSALVTCSPHCVLPFFSFVPDSAPGFGSVLETHASVLPRALWISFHSVLMSYLPTLLDLPLAGEIVKSPELIFCMVKTISRKIQLLQKSLCEVVKIILKYLEGRDTGIGDTVCVLVLVIYMGNMQKLARDLH